MSPGDYQMFRLALSRAEDRRLDPPDEHEIDCLYCEGNGKHAPNQKGDAVECDVCEGTGVMSEPEEWAC